MTAKSRRTNTEAAPAGDKIGQNRRDEAWDDRLRTVGNARFVEVEWSGKDHPVWPLPKK